MTEHAETPDPASALSAEAAFREWWADASLQGGWLEHDAFLAGYAAALRVTPTGESAGPDEVPFDPDDPEGWGAELDAHPIGGHRGRSSLAAAPSPRPGADAGERVSCLGCDAPGTSFCDECRAKQDAAAPPTAPLPEADGELKPHCWFMKDRTRDESAGPFDTAAEGLAWAKMSAGRYEDWEPFPLYSADARTAARADAVGLRKERDEADRRAGEATRRMADLVDGKRKTDSWLSDAKRERGYHDNVSFDDVWAETCAKADQRDKAVADLIEATAELLYLRQYGKLGALWVANDSKPYWREKARTYLEHIPPHPRDAEGAGT